jgi:Fe-S-cluster containining protein
MTASTAMNDPYVPSRSFQALTDVMAEVTIAARSLALELASRTESARLAAALAVTMAELYEAAASRLANALPNQPKMACGRGCSACCYLPVRADVVTVLLLVEHVRETWSKSQISALKRRVDAHVAETDARPHAVPADRPPCPFLIDRECSVHAYRPLVCRAMNSFDLEDCHEAAETGRVSGAIEGNPIPSMVAKAVQKGLNEALTFLGFAAHPVSFTDALQFALETPDAAQQWAATKKFMP